MKTLTFFFAFAAALGLHYFGDASLVETGSAMMAAAPMIATIGNPNLGLIKVQRPHITAMPTIVNEAYLERFLLPKLISEYQNDKEDFLALLNGVPKRAIGKEGIYKNKLVGNVEGVINNTVDFDAPVPPDKSHVFIPWDTVDTKPQRVSRSELRALPYDIKAALRVKHMNVIKRLTRDLLLWRLAPQTDSANAPIIELPSNNMSYGELVKASTRLKLLNVDLRDVMIIFAPKHVEDLAVEQGGGERFRERMYDEAAGKPKGFAGFKNVFEHNDMPKYDDTTHEKLAYGSLTGTACTMIVNIPEVVFHREGMTIYYKPMIQDTRSADPTDEFRLGGYFAADTLENKGFIALV